MRSCPPRIARARRGASDRECTEVVEGLQSPVCRERLPELASHRHLELSQHLWAQYDVLAMVGDDLSSPHLLVWGVGVEQTNTFVSTNQGSAVMQFVACPSRGAPCGLRSLRQVQQVLDRLSAAVLHAGVRLQISPNHSVDGRVFLNRANPGALEDLLVDRDGQVSWA